MDEEFRIHIKTLADLKAAEASQKALERAIATAKKQGKETGDMERQLKGLNAEIKRQGDAVRQSSSAWERLTHQFPLLGKAAEVARNPVAALLGSVVSLVFAGKRLVQTFAEQELAASKLSAALRQNNILTSENVDAYGALATQLQNETSIAADKWVEVLARLTQFGSRPESIGMDAEAVKNLAAIMGGGEGSLLAAATLVGKVMQGNTGALSEYGITVDQSLPKIEQQAQLFQKINQVGGGQLAETAQTLTGRWKNLQNQGDALGAELGRIIERFSGLRDRIDEVANAAEFWAEVLQKLRGASQDTARQVEDTTMAVARQADTVEFLSGLLDGLRNSSGGAASALGQVRAEAEALRQTQDRLDDLDMAIELEQLRQRGLPAAQQLQAERSIRTKYADRKLQRDLAGFEADSSAAQGAATASQSDLDAAIRRRGELKGELETAGKVDELSSKIEEARKVVEQLAGKAGIPASAITGATGPLGVLNLLKELGGEVVDRETARLKEAERAIIDSRLQRREILEQNPNLRSSKDVQAELSTQEQIVAELQKRNQETAQEAAARIQANEAAAEARKQIEQRQRTLADLQTNTGIQSANRSELEQFAARNPQALLDQAAGRFPEQVDAARQALRSARSDEGAAMKALIDEILDLQRRQAEQRRQIELLRQQSANLRTN